MALGVVGLFFLFAPALTTMPGMPEALCGWRWKRKQRAGFIALLLVAIHLVILGSAGWLVRGGWHGGFPPISMVAVGAGGGVPLILGRRLQHDGTVRAGGGSRRQGRLKPGNTRGKLRKAPDCRAVWYVWCWCAVGRQQADTG